MKLPSDNLSYPVRILVGDSSGSGFIVGSPNGLYLVTARHVIYQQDQNTKVFNLLDEKMRMIVYPLLEGKISSKPRVFEINLKFLCSSQNLKMHKDVDAVVIKLADIKNESGQSHAVFLEGVNTIQQSEGTIINYNMSGSRNFNDVEVTNDIFIIGYPVSLSTNEMKQIDYDSPLARKGIIAGKNLLNKTLILDCPVYGGNSGGLVLEMDNTGLGTRSIHLIGVVVQFVPFVDQWRNIRFPELFNTNLQNSGYSVAVPIDFIKELIMEIESK